MRGTHRSKAIVLSRGDFGEADRYVQFLTERWGMISLLARSARKSQRRYVGGLDLFCHDEICLRGEPRERGYLIELSVLNSFQELRTDLNKLFSAGKMVQWIRKLANIATPMPGVYRLLGQMLALTEKESRPERLETLELLFKIRLLSQLGLRPRVDNCSRCDGDLKGSHRFDMNSGGLVCVACLEKDPSEISVITEEASLLLAQADRIRLSQWGSFEFPIFATRQLSSMMTQFASYHGHTSLP